MIYNSALASVSIAAVVRSSTIDYPGQIAAVLFTSWCNMCCPYCHNVDILGGDAGSKLNLELVTAWLADRFGALTGVVLSGGEPTMLPDEKLQELLEELKGIGYAVKLDTNGTYCALQSKLTKPCLDYIAVDVKLPRARYQELMASGTDNGKMAASKLAGNLVWLDRVFVSQWHKQYELRTTVHKKLLPLEAIYQLKADWVDPRKTHPKWYLQQYGKSKGFDPDLQNEPTYSDEDLADIAVGIGAYVRGVDPALAAKVEKTVDERTGRAKENK